MELAVINARWYFLAAPFQKLKCTFLFRARAYRNDWSHKLYLLMHFLYPLANNHQQRGDK